MKQEGLAHFTDTHLTVVGMLIFLFAFLLIIIWVSRRELSEHYLEMGKLPLEHDQETSDERR